MPLPMVPATLRPEDEKGDEVEEGRPDDGRCGLRTRVETTVAIELAASWKPLRKSNTRASPINSHTTGRQLPEWHRAEAGARR